MQKLIKFITFEEFKILHSKAKDKYTKLAIILGFGSGLRISEVVGYKHIPPLMPDNINLIAHQIKIFGKGSKERITVCSPALKEEHLKLLPIKIPRRTLQYRIQKLSEKHIGKKISFHTLRHGFGNYMVNEKRMSLPEVQGFMGHSRIDTTGIYTKANPKQAIEKAWESFNN